MPTCASRTSRGNRQSKCGSRFSTAGPALEPCDHRLEEWSGLLSRTMTAMVGMRVRRGCEITCLFEELERPRFAEPGGSPLLVPGVVSGWSQYTTSAQAEGVALRQRGSRPLELRGDGRW